MFVLFLFLTLDANQRIVKLIGGIYLVSTTTRVFDHSLSCIWSTLSVVENPESS